MARKCAILVLLVAAAASAQSKRTATDQAALARRIETILAAPELQKNLWGVEVVSLPDGKVLYQHNAEKLMQPASNTKLFATAATLALIGPDYKFQTTVEGAAAPDSKGRLAGDIYLVGRGDPNLSARVLPFKDKTELQGSTTQALEELADEVVKAGVKQVDGDVVGDDTYYVWEFPDGWTRDDLQWDYGAPVSALTVNDNSVFLDIAPGDKVGEKAAIKLDPASDYFQVNNRIVTSAPGTKREVGIHRDPGSKRIELWGEIPVDSKTEGEEIAVEDPAEFAAQIFRDLLVKRGIAVMGTSRAKHIVASDEPAFPAPGGGQQAATQACPGAECAPPPAAAGGIGVRTVLAMHESKPLYEDLRVINKVSQNLHAELALRLLGKLKADNGSIAGGLSVLRGFLSQAGIQPDEYFFRDASGLSRETLATPSAFTKLLRYVHSQPWADKYMDTLPRSAVDGGLRERLNHDHAKEHVRAKTGLYEHVRTLSGYAQTASGNNVAFAVMANNTLEGRQATEVIDRIVEAVVEDKAP
jgi:D-alanyl-D-alanine carboxypeptidase/D-alanyl-D-alanine-endopeptidase (penicillin-binding protein 4)